MENILYNDFRMPKEAQLRRIHHVMENELTQIQRELLVAIYYEGKTQAQYAKERGVSRSTVHRTLRRAEERLRRYLRY